MLFFHRIQVLQSLIIIELNFVDDIAINWFRELLNEKTTKKECSSSSTESVENREARALT